MQFDQLKRRNFIALLGGAAAWPLAAHAQQPKVARLGYLEPGTPTDPVAANLRRQFLLGLRDLGYVEGRHFKMEDRSAGGRLDRLPALASELARLPVDIFVVGGDAPIRAAMQASDKISVVMTLGGDLAEVGGLATYGTNRADLWRRSASYVDKIVRGANPGDLPVEQPTKFEMVINLNTAKAIGVEIAPTMLTRADEVIE
jgi:hypothetical protein